MPGSAVIVSFRTEKVVAGVLSDRFGNVCFGVWPPGAEEHPLTVLEGETPTKISGLGWTAVGGRLPAGAQLVELRDTGGKWHRGAVAHGVWAGVIPGDVGAPPAELPPIRFRGNDGEVISRVRSTDRLRPMLDADLALLRRAGFDERCPACDGAAWGLMVPGAGLGDRVVCMKCGYTDGAVRGFYSVRH